MPRKDAYGGSISAQAQQDLVSEGIENFELPKSLVMKIAKSAVPDNVKLQKETVLSLVKGSTVFINYLAATAHDVAQSRQHKSISASDVIKALEIMQFRGVAAQAQQELNDYRELMKHAEAKSKKTGTSNTSTTSKKAVTSTSTANAVSRSASLSSSAKGKGKEKASSSSSSAAAAAVMAIPLPPPFTSTPLPMATNVGQADDDVRPPVPVPVPVPGPVPDESESSISIGGSGGGAGAGERVDEPMDVDNDADARVVGRDEGFSPWPDSDDDDDVDPLLERLHATIIGLQNNRTANHFESKP